MTASLFNNQNGSFGNVIDGFVYPQFIVWNRAPNTNDVYNPGTRIQDNSANPPLIYGTTGAGRWYVDAGGSTSFNSLTVTPGPTSITGTTSINTSGAGTTALGTGGTGAVTLGNSTGGTAVTGNMTFGTATQGVIQTAVIVTGASPQTANARVFSVTFSGVSIAAAATQSFTISNSTITGSTTVIQLTMAGATTGAALNIQSVTNSANQSVIVVENGTGATTSTANITFIGHVLN